MRGLLIHNVSPGNVNIPLQGDFLVFLHADKVPPHLGICVQDQFLSLKISGVEMLSQEILFRSIQLKKIPSLFLKLDVPTSGEDLLLMSKNIFNGSNSLDENTTCLDPIKVWSRFVFSINPHGINSIHDLMPLLEEKGVLMEAYAYHLPIFPAHTYEIGYYGKSEIQARINRLSI